MKPTLEEIDQKSRSLMKKAVERVEREISRIQTGRVHPDMLLDVKILYYESLSPLHQVSSIQTQDATTLVIKPFDKSLIKEIKQALHKSELGLHAQDDGETILVRFPSLSEERRKEMVKRVKKDSENGKIAVRNVRKEINEEIKKAQKEKILTDDEAKQFTGKVQELTDSYIQQIDTLAEEKEKKLLKI
ncbi:MAG: ribosome recycling factor [Cytophagales bacterium]|nr:ribosome recycling factor [Cytophagales bacterium]